MELKFNFIPDASAGVFRRRERRSVRNGQIGFVTCRFKQQSGKELPATRIRIQGCKGYGCHNDTVRSHDQGVIFTQQNLPISGNPGHGVGSGILIEFSLKTTERASARYAAGLPCPISESHTQNRLDPCFGKGGGWVFGEQNQSTTLIEVVFQRCHLPCIMNGRGMHAPYHNGIIVQSRLRDITSSQVIPPISPNSEVAEYLLVVPGSGSPFVIG